MCIQILHALYDHINCYFFLFILPLNLFIYLGWSSSFSIAFISLSKTTSFCKKSPFEVDYTVNLNQISVFFTNSQGIKPESKQKPKFTFIILKNRNRKELQNPKPKKTHKNIGSHH